MSIWSAEGVGMHTEEGVDVQTAKGVGMHTEEGVGV